MSYGWTTRGVLLSPRLSYWVQHARGAHARGGLVSYWVRQVEEQWREVVGYILLEARWVLNQPTDLQREAGPLTQSLLHLLTPTTLPLCVATGPLCGGDAAAGAACVPTRAGTRPQAINTVRQYNRPAALPSRAP